MADAATADPQVESRARQLGWVPQEQFRGDASRWVDAETFVRKGEEIMPILKQNNKQLQGDVDRLTGALAETRALVQAGQEAITALKESQTEFTKQAVARTKSEIRTRIREAREANDSEALAELEDQLDDIRDAEREVKAATAAAPAPAPASPATPRLDPAFVAWQGENPWFGKDKRRTALTLAEAEELRSDPENRGLVGRAFYEKAAAAADAILNPRSTTSKVESGSQSANQGAPGGGGAGKKSYRDLPADAKVVCDRQAEMLVGKGRAFKTAAEWQQNYADQYFAQE